MDLQLSLGMKTANVCEWYYLLHHLYKHAGVAINQAVQPLVLDIRVLTTGAHGVHIEYYFGKVMPFALQYQTRKASCALTLCT